MVAREAPLRSVNRSVSQIVPSQISLSETGEAEVIAGRYGLCAPLPSFVSTLLLRIFFSPSPLKSSRTAYPHHRPSARTSRGALLPLIGAPHHNGMGGRSSSTR